MASRTGYVGTENVGDVLTKTNYDKGPGGLLNYVAYTSNSATFTNSETDLNANLTMTVVTGTSRTVMLVADLQAASDTSGDRIRFLWSTGVSGAGTDLTFADVTIGGTNFQSHIHFECLVQTSGSQSFHIRALRQSGSGNCSVVGTNLAGSAVTSQSWIGAYDLGPAF